MRSLVIRRTQIPSWASRGLERCQRLAELGKTLIPHVVAQDMVSVCFPSHFPLLQALQKRAVRHTRHVGRRSHATCGKGDLSLGIFCI